MRIVRIEEHSGTDAVTAAGTFEDIVVDTAFATSPESLVVCQVAKVTGTYPNSVFIFMTAAPEVRLKILAWASAYEPAGRSSP